MEPDEILRRVQTLEDLGRWDRWLLQVAVLWWVVLLLWVLWEVWKGRRE